jgi:hypothetical protein
MVATVEHRYRMIATSQPGWSIYHNDTDVVHAGADAIIWLAFHDGEWFAEMYVDTERHDGGNDGLTLCRTPLSELLDDVIGPEDVGEQAALRSVLVQAIERIDGCSVTDTAASRAEQA